MFKRMDLLLLGLTVVLTLFGLAMIASVSVFESYQLTTHLGGEGHNSFYLWRTFIHVIVGLCGMMVVSTIPYRVWERFAKPMYFGTILLLVLVFIPMFKPAGAQTSNSWINLGFFTLQPAEILKLTFIFYLSTWLQKREQLIGTFKEGFVPFATLLLISTFLVAIQPDLGSFLVISAIAAVMFLIAGGGIFHLLLGGGLAGIIGIPVILQKEYIRLRFLGFFTLLFMGQEETRKICETKAAYQVCQALIAIGSGGFFGVGYGKSIQKFGYLPEVQGDMIFSVMAEELGFVRLLIILLMYGMLVYRGYRIAENAPDRFGFLLASGITTWIAVQTIVNISVNIGIFPITGLTLPFISYGGSSLLTLLGAVGILLNISMHSTEEASLARREKVKSEAIRWKRVRRA